MHANRECSNMFAGATDRVLYGAHQVVSSVMVVCYQLNSSLLAAVFAVPAYIYTPTKVKLMEAEEMNIQPRNINGGEASTMNLPIRLAVCALQNCGMCGVE